MMHLSSWSNADIKRACSQSCSDVSADMHLQPPGGVLVNSTPWRQACLRLNLHARRLAAKLRVSILWLKDASEVELETPPDLPCPDEEASCSLERWGVAA